MGKLIDAIKAMFTRNTTNAASVAGARIPFVQADGTPIGNDTIANLGSVLGGFKYNGSCSSYGSSVSEINTIGYYNVDSNLTGLPSDVQSSGLLFVFPLNSTRGIKVYWPAYGAALYFSLAWTGYSVWYNVPLNV